MNILLIDDDISILELLSIIIENTFEATNIARATSPALGIKELQGSKIYDLVICDYEMYPHGTGQEVFDYISKNSLTCLYLLFTSVDLENIEFIKTPVFKVASNFTLRKPCHPRGIREKLQEIVNIEENKAQEYKKIKIHNFIRFNLTKCDVFIKINDKYIKILHKNEHFSIDFINKYIKKNVKEFFIQGYDYDEFLVEFGKLNFLVSTQNSKDYREGARKSHLYLSSLLTNVGISEFILEEASNLALKSLEVVKTEKNLSSLIEELIKSNDYSYDHTFLITSLCTHIGAEIALNKQSIEKLAFASLIHDLGITKTKLCYIHDIMPLEISKLEHEDQFIIKNHHNILTTISGVADLTDDVLNIIKYHHIFDQNYGFGDKIQLERISPIVGTFLVAHFFSNEFYKSGLEIVKVRDILTLIKFNFNTQNFNKIIRALEILILKKNIF